MLVFNVGINVLLQVLVCFCTGYSHGIVVLLGFTPRFGKYAVRKSSVSGADLPGSGSACLLLRRPRDLESLKSTVPQFPVPYSGIILCPLTQLV